MRAIFDTADYVEATRPPVFKHEGTEVEGIVLSIEETIRWGQRLDALRDPKGEAKESPFVMLRLFRAFFDDVFPPPPPIGYRRRWLGLVKVPIYAAPTVGQILGAQPLKVQLEAIRSFSETLAAAHGLPREEASAETSPGQGPTAE